MKRTEAEWETDNTSQEASQNQYCKCNQGRRRGGKIKQVKSKKKFWIYPKCMVDLPETRINNRKDKAKAISLSALEHEKREESSRWRQLYLKI